MNYRKIYTGCLLSLCMATTSHAALATQHSGQDKSVEWQQKSQWSTTERILDMVHSLDGKNVFLLNDKAQVQVFSNTGDLLGSIPVDKGVSAIDIAPQGETLYLIDNYNNSFTSLSLSFIQEIDVTGSPFEGPGDAPVTIALFTDFEWPYCSKILPLIEQVLDKNPETVKVVFKNMPLNFHKMALPAARAALAAEQQGKFWEFHDKLFAEKKLSKASLTRIAKSLDLDMDKFTADMESPAVMGKIQKDMLDARKAGVTGTPTVFINGRKPAKRSLEGFQEIIDEELKKQGN